MPPRPARRPRANHESRPAASRRLPATSRRRGTAAGAIAAGHPLTARVGADVLAAGGNAFDACVAAAFASWVVESPLAGPGGGGFLLARPADGRGDALYDFFVTVPGAERRWTPRPMAELAVDFADGGTSQPFRVGASSCAVPGTAAGLEAVHRRYATRPWRSLLEPAVRLARDGFELTPAQGYLHAILDPILRREPEGRRVYSAGDGAALTGERLRLPDLADTLERLADEGAAALSCGELAGRIARHIREQGGALTAADLASYRVVRRRPVRARFRDTEYVSNPPPSSGGLLIAYGLRLLDELGSAPRAGSVEAISALAEVMGEQARARERSFARDLYRGGLPRRLLADDAVGAAVARIGSGGVAAREARTAGGTTHVSVVDRDGNAASLSASLGSGSGVVVPGTGIHLNNMLGEYDLAPGAWLRVGERLTSMMAPSIVVHDGRPALVVGSAGSARLRGAIMQVVVNVVDHGLDAAHAVAAPRVHLDGSQLHCEGGHERASLAEVAAGGFEVVRWRGRNLFFGGAAVVEVTPEGTLRAAGDPRRGGHGIVVDG